MQKKFRGDIWNKELKLPSLKKFESKSINVSPFHLFYKWIMKELEPNNKGNLARVLFNQGSKQLTIKVAHVWLAEKDYYALNKLVKKWIKHTHPNSPTKSIESMFYIHVLELAPCMFLKAHNPKWAKEGYAYILKDPFTVVNKEGEYV